MSCRICTTDRLWCGSPELGLRSLLYDSVSLLWTSGLGLMGDSDLDSYIDVSVGLGLGLFVNVMPWHKRSLYYSGLGGTGGTVCCSSALTPRRRLCHKKCGVVRHMVCIRQHDQSPGFAHCHSSFIMNSLSDPLFSLFLCKSSESTASRTRHAVVNRSTLAQSLWPAQRRCHCWSILHHVVHSRRRFISLKILIKSGQT